MYTYAGEIPFFFVEPIRDLASIETAVLSGGVANGDVRMGITKVRRNTTLQGFV